MMMRLPTKSWRLVVISVLSGLMLWAWVSLSIAAEKPALTMAPSAPSVAGSPLMLKKDTENTSPGIPLTHQMPPSGNATGEEQPAAACRPFKIETPATLPAGTVDRPFNVTIRVSGGVPPVSFALIKGAVLPPGLALNSRGRISGTPLVPGGYHFGILAYDRCPAGVQAEENHFRLTIHNAVSTTLPNGNEAVYRRIPVGGEPALHVTGVHLFFENQGTSIVVGKDATLPKLMAQVRLEGEGILRGYWQVDHADVRPFVSRATGPLAVVAFPAQAVLPTSTPGRHDIRFVITNARGELPDSSASYRILGGQRRGDDTINRQILVTVRPEASRRIEDDLIRAYKVRLVEQFDIRSLKLRTYVFESDGDLTDQVNAIRKEQDVIQAERNQVFTTFGDPKSPMQQIAATFQFDSLHTQRTGRGVTVAIVDTGVDADHPDLIDRVTVNENMVASSPFKAEIHGTAVAGIIGASRNGFGIEGVAPEVELLALRACRQVSETHPGGQGDTVAMVKALDVALMKKAKIVNMSFGAPRPDRLMEMLLEKGAAAGILFVAPVGNEQGMRSAWFPASSPMVIAVGGRDAKGDPYPDEHAVRLARVCAPAENIFATIPEGRFNFLTGTSMSSAIVAGILALAVEQNPGLHQKDILPFEGNACQWLRTLMDVNVCDP